MFLVEKIVGCLLDDPTWTDDKTIPAVVFAGDAKEDGPVGFGADGGTPRFGEKLLIVEGKFVGEASGSCGEEKGGTVGSGDGGTEADDQNDAADEERDENC